MAQQAQVASEVASVRRTSSATAEIGLCGKNFNAPRSSRPGGRDGALLCSTIT